MKREPHWLGLFCGSQEWPSSFKNVSSLFKLIIYSVFNCEELNPLDVLEVSIVLTISDHIQAVTLRLAKQLFKVNRRAAHFQVVIVLIFLHLDHTLDDGVEVFFHVLFIQFVANQVL